MAMVTYSVIVRLETSWMNRPDETASFIEELESRGGLRESSDLPLNWKVETTLTKWYLLLETDVALAPSAVWLLEYFRRFRSQFCNIVVGVKVLEGNKVVDEAVCRTEEELAELDRLELLAGDPVVAPVVRQVPRPTSQVALALQRHKAARAARAQASVAPVVRP